MKFGKEFRELVYKGKVKAVHLAIKASLWLHWPGATAGFFALAAKSLNSGAEYKVLCLGRSIFDDDIRAMVEFSAQINYQIIHLQYFQMIFDHFTDKIDRQQLTESNYHIVEHCAAGKIKYRQYLAKMIPKLRRLLKFQAVISGNIGYIVQQELARVCAEINVPFVVLHKEALVVLSAYGNFLQNYKHHHFVGTKVLFYNRQCMKGFLELNLPGLSLEKAGLVGIPRLDNYFQKKTDVNEENLVVFFSFIPRFSCRFLTSDEERLKKIDEKGREFFISVMEFAGKHPELTFIVKTKMAAQYLDYPSRILYELFPGGLANLSIVNSGDPAALIKRAKIVIGFNSTTLVEALIAGKKIAMPDFSDIMAGEAWSFFEEHPGLVKSAKSAQDLEDCLNAPADMGRVSGAKNDFLEKYISTATGGASARTEKNIIDLILSSEDGF